MSNCNACDQQSQRQINVKECFASLEVNELSLFLIHALQGGKIRFENSAIRQGPCGDSCALSMTIERKVRGRKICRLSDFRWRGLRGQDGPLPGRCPILRARF